jgi:hypothetical protein
VRGATVRGGSAGTGGTATSRSGPNRTSDPRSIARRAVQRARTAPVGLAAGIAVLLALLGVGWGAGAHRSPKAVAAAASASVRTAPVAAVAAARTPALVTVPNLLGMDYAAAGRAMRRLALKPSFAARISNAAPESVLAQYPAAGTQIRPGSTALVVISTGPRPAVDLRGGEAYLKLPPGQRGHAKGHHGRGHGHHGKGDGGEDD